jgi:alpha-glucosidase (family GH31 glycosyl hydrolase)
MYKETTPLIRDIIKRRYELIPYLYSLALESHQTATPPQRWTGWGYESDPEVWSNKILTDGETQYWLGDSLLIGGVFQPGADSAKMYLPKDPAQPGLEFLDLNNAPQTYYSAGQWVDIPANWSQSIPVLAKVGSAIPIGRNGQVLAIGDTSNPANLPLDDYRAVEVFTPKCSSNDEIFTNTWYEDDGVSPPPAKISVFVLKYQTTKDEVLVEYEEQLQPEFTPHWKDLTIILPAGDGRMLKMNGEAAKSAKRDGKGRTHFKCAISRATKPGALAKSKI